MILETLLKHYTQQPPITEQDKRIHNFCLVVDELNDDRVLNNFSNQESFNLLNEAYQKTFSTNEYISLDKANNLIEDLSGYILSNRYENFNNNNQVLKDSINNGVGNDTIYGNRIRKNDDSGLKFTKETKKKLDKERDEFLSGGNKFGNVNEENFSILQDINESLERNLDQPEYKQLSKYSEKRRAMEIDEDNGHSWRIFRNNKVLSKRRVVYILTGKNHNKAEDMYDDRDEILKKLDDIKRQNKLSTYKPLQIIFDSDKKTVTVVVSNKMNIGKAIILDIKGNLINIEPVKKVYNDKRIPMHFSLIEEGKRLVGNIGKTIKNKLSIKNRVNTLLKNSADIVGEGVENIESYIKRNFSNTVIEDLLVQLFVNDNLVNLKSTDDEIRKNVASSRIALHNFFNTDLQDEELNEVKESLYRKFTDTIEDLYEDKFESDIKYLYKEIEKIKDKIKKEFYKRDEYKEIIDSITGGTYMSEEFFSYDDMWFCYYANMNNFSEVTIEDFSLLLGLGVTGAAIGSGILHKKSLDKIKELERNPVKVKDFADRRDYVVMQWLKEFQGAVFELQYFKTITNEADLQAYKSAISRVRALLKRFTELHGPEDIKDLQDRLRNMLRDFDHNVYEVNMKKWSLESLKNIHNKLSDICIEVFRGLQSNTLYSKMIKPLFFSNATMGVSSSNVSTMMNDKGQMIGKGATMTSIDYFNNKYKNNRPGAVGGGGAIASAYAGMKPMVKNNNFSNVSQPLSSESAVRNVIEKLIAEAEEAYSNDTTSDLYYWDKRNTQEEKDDLIKAVRELKNVRPDNLVEHNDGSLSVSIYSARWNDIMGHTINIDISGSNPSKYWVSING